jgi:hypothetical protein
MVEEDLRLFIKNAPCMHLCCTEEPDHSDVSDLNRELERSVCGELSEITPHDVTKPWKLCHLYTLARC